MSPTCRPLLIKNSISGGTVMNDARSVVPQHRERIFLVGFKERRGFEFPEFPAEGPKLETILEANPLEKYTLTDQLWS